jgi:hypothetical protein
MFKTTGVPYEVWEEHRMHNPASFSTTQAMNSDDWAQQAGVYQISPARVQAGQTLQHDTTAYSTIPIEQSWNQRMRSNLSPAKVTASATGTLHEGQLT